MIPGVLLKDKSRKAISQIAHSEMAKLIPLIQKLLILDIDNVAPQFLPFLATQFRVEFWDNDWSDQQKREKIKTALARFRTLGTPYAVEHVLGFLSDVYGFPLTLTEWFSMVPEGERGTFEINLDTENAGFELNDEFWQQLFTGIESNKRYSQHWRMRITGAVSGRVSVGSYLYSVESGSLIGHE